MLISLQKVLHNQTELLLRNCVKDGLQNWIFFDIPERYLYIKEQVFALENVPQPRHNINNLKKDVALTQIYRNARLDTYHEQERATARPGFWALH